MNRLRKELEDLYLLHDVNHISFEDYHEAIIDAIINSLPSERLGIQDQGLIDKNEPWLGVAKYCSMCGGHDECDCEGFNECLGQIKQLLAESKEV